MKAKNTHYPRIKYRTLLKRLFVFFQIGILIFTSFPVVAFADEAKIKQPDKTTETSSSLITETASDTQLQFTPGTLKGGIKGLKPSFTYDKTQLSASKFAPAKVRKLKKDNYSPNEEIEVIIENGANKVLATKLINAKGMEVAIETEEDVTGNTKVVTLKQPNSFRPGHYIVEITDDKGGVSEQDFSWGVLAINPDKSIYAPGETANLAIAVLNEIGEMVCDAQVELQITNPNQETESLSTDNGKIIVNKECESHDFTLKPDYETNYKTAGVGVYEMTLKSQTKNGSYMITDSFEVRKSVPFDVKRISATRIYPPHSYPVTMEIVANQDFNGTVTETLPASFKVSRPGEKVKTDQDEVDEEIASLSDCSIAPSPNPLPTGEGSNNETIKPCNNEAKPTPSPKPVVVAPDNLPATKPIGYSTVNNLSEPVNGKAVLGASVPNLGMPFSGSFPVSQEFGDSLVKDMHDRDLYAQFGMHGHDGMDFAMPEGTPILAVDDGKIVRAGDGDYGKTVVIQHAWGRSYYGHLSEVTAKEGEQVSRGATIGKSGNTGISTGPHLHFGIRPDKDTTDNGYYGKVDPAYYLGLKLSAGQVLGAANFAAADNNETIQQSDNANSDVQILTWKISVKKGDKITIGYNYLAPRLSPQFYNLGPAVFTDTSGNKVFQEQRKWQIAADALELKFKRGSFAKVNCAATCTQTVTGVGFKPKAIIFEWTNNTAEGFSAHNDYGMGFVTASSSAGLMAERSVSFCAEDAITTTDTSSRRSDTKAIMIQSTDCGPTAGSAVIAEADLTAFESDGFTLSWTTNNATQYIIHYTAIGGSDLSNARASTFSLTTSTGTQTVAEPGFRPDFVMFLSSDTTAMNTNSSSGTGGRMNIGFASSPNKEGSTTMWSDDNIGTTDGRRQQRADASIALLTTAGAQDAVADLSSFESNGFVMNKSDTPTSTTDIFYLALQGGVYDVGSFAQPTSTGSQSVYTGFAPSGLMTLAASSSANGTIEPTGASLSTGGASWENSSNWCNDTTGVTCTAEGTTIQPTSTDWCNDNSGVTCTSSWTKRKKITFNNGASSENLTDFPVLVKLNANRIDYNKTNNNGSDIRFVDPSDPATVLPHEIESWNENGESYVWVKVPQINANSTTDYIWMYYNNPSASDGQAATSVWSNYDYVYHLNGSTTNSATGNTSATFGSDAINTTGKIGNAREMRSPYSGPALLTGEDRTSGTGVTVQTWYKPDTFKNWHDIFLQGWVGDGADLNVNSTGVPNWNIADGGVQTTVAGSAIQDGEWSMLAGTYDGSTSELYTNGVASGNPGSVSGAYTDTTSVSQLIATGDQGAVDEFRLSSVARSAEWLETDYINQTDNLNSFGSEISYSTSTTTTSGWTARRKITFNNIASGEDLIDFPVMVKLSSASGNIDFDKTKFNGEDIRFVDPTDPNTVLSHEIEKWNEPGGEAVVWVKVPKIDASSSADMIWMYYGNPDAPDGQDKENVWDANYVGVWHMKEDPSGVAPQMTDSTKYGNDGYSVGSMTSGDQVAGKIDGSIDFDGSNDTINASSAAVLDDLTDITYSAWIDHTSYGDISLGRIVDKGTNSSGWSALVCNNGTNGTATLCWYNGRPATTDGWWNAPSNALNTAGGFYHTAVTYNASSNTNDPTMYINGASVGVNESQTPAGTIGTDAALDLYFGDRADGARSYSGLIDEIRISNVIRSADWVEAEYISGNNAMNIFSAEETQAAGTNTFSQGSIWSDDIDNIPDSNNATSSRTDTVIQFATSPNLTGASRTLAKANVESFDPTGFTVKWSEADSVGRQVLYWAVGSVTASQDDFRWYKNTNGITPTTALEDENRSTIIPANKPYARLRTNLSVGGNGMNASSSAFKLQYASDRAEKSVGGTTDWCNDTTGVTCTAPNTGELPANITSDWCNDTSGVMCTSDWSSRRKISFNTASISANLTDFPVLVKLDSTRINYSKTQNSGQDIRFVDPSDPNTVLPHEIETWNESGSSYVWVKVPTLTAQSGADYIWMYYGNSTVTDGQAITSVWDSDFLGVYHLEDDPTTICATTKEICDATSNANNADNESGMAANQMTTGKVGGALNFSSDTLRIAASASLNTLTSAITFSAWARSESIDTFYRRVISRGASPSQDWYVENDGGDPGKMLYDGGKGNESSNRKMVQGQWHYLTVTTTGTTTRFYLDGTLDKQTTETGSFVGTADIGIGGDPGVGSTWDGDIDEVRISDAARSADWVAAEYLNMTDAMTTYGTEINYSDVQRSSSGWEFRKKITFNNASASAALTDFPVLVKLDASRIDYSKTQDDGGDIRFVDPNDRTTVLAHEIESWNENGNSFVWVKVPQLDANSTTDYIWMYYGNPGVSDGQAGTSVWDSNTKMVQHLEESSACAVTFTDSTSNTSDGSCASTPTYTSSGKIDGARTFNGSSDYITVTDSVPLSPTNTMTLSLWANQTTLTTNKVLTGKWNHGSQESWILQTYNSDSSRLAFYIADSLTDAGNNLVITPVGSWTTGWHHVSIVFNGSGSTDADKYQFYIDGIRQSLTYSFAVSSPTSITDSNAAIRIGNTENLNRFWNGGLDEVRFASTNRSTDWIEAEYLTQTDRMNAFGEEQPYTVSGVTTGGWTDVADVWCSDNAGVTCNTSWPYRKRITIDNSSSSTDLTDFPVMVKLDSTRIDYSRTQDDGGDIRFIDPSDPSTVLPHEIESWDETGDSFVWVKVPRLKAKTNYGSIWMYYGNTSVSDGQAATSVWDSNFKMVNHLSDDPTGSAPEMLDSTSNNHDGTTGGSLTADDMVKGQVNGALDFDSSESDNITVTNHANFEPAGDFTASFWVKLDQTAMAKGSAHMFLYKNHTVSPWYTYQMYQDEGNNHFYVNWVNNGGTDSTIETNTALVAGKWYYLTYVKSGTRGSVYINGVNDTLSSPTYSGTSYDSNGDFLIGGISPKFTDGMMDEVRFSGDDRSADWVRAEYQTQIDAMNTFGPEETQTSAVWRFKDNTSAINTAIITSPLLSTSANGNQQTYQESGLTAPNPTAIAVGERREWDFSLDGSLASPRRTYYFRLVNADGTPLTSYTRYASITFGVPNEKLMRNGKWFNYGAKQPFTF